MSEPYMGQILFAGFNFAPKQYAGCDGGTLSVSQNAALFSLLGTTYGGDGRTTFMLPDLRGRSVQGGFNSVDGGWQPPATYWGQIQGSETVTLGVAQLPSHTHAINVSSSAGDNTTPISTTFATAATNVYGPATADTLVPLGGSPMTDAGSGLPHDNMQPFTVIEAAIALQGYFPSRP